MKYDSLLYVLFSILSLFSTKVFADPSFPDIVPYIIAPTTNETQQQNNRVSFQWNDIDSAELYEIVAFPLDAQGNTLWTTALFSETLFATECNAGVCTLNKPVYSKSATWKLRAIRFTNTAPVQKERTRYSPYQDFTLESDPPLLDPPIPLSPSESYTKYSDKVSFQWQPLTGVDLYEVFLSSVDNNGETSWELSSSIAASEAGCNNKGMTCIFSVSIPLNINTASWKVRGITALGTGGEYSAPQLFSLLNPVGYPDYFPANVRIPDWAAKEATTMSAPVFQEASQDDDTGYLVWRLGGSASEMGGQLAHPSGNNTISEHHSQHYYSRTNVRPPDLRD